VSALQATGPEDEEAAQGGGECSFSHPPAGTYVWDPACAGGGLGCRADGVHNECRWCGFAAFAPCPAASAPSPVPTAAPAPSAPGGGGGAGDWRPSGETLGSGHCRAEVPHAGWQLRSTCGSGPEVRVLSYNLFWWNLFIERGGNGRSAGRLIQANGPFDIMGFQECEDAPRVLRDAELGSSYVALPGRHATAIAYRAAAWEELSSGHEDVAEDRPEQYYGLRGAGWARLRHKQSGHTVFVMNHHGPLPVNTGGKCGGEATAYNLLRLAGRHAAPGDAVILLGDINADVNSATQQTLRERLHRLAHDWVDAVFASCPGLSSRNLGSGGSDHNAIEAVLRL